MQTLLIALAVVLMGVILALLVWLINNQMAERRELSAQAAGLSSLQKQIEDVRVAQEKTSSGLQQSLQTGQDRLFGSLKHSQEVITRLNSQIGQLQGASQQMVALGSGTWTMMMATFLR